MFSLIVSFQLVNQLLITNGLEMQFCAEWEFWRKKLTRQQGTINNAVDFIFDHIMHHLSISISTHHDRKTG